MVRIAAVLALGLLLPAFAKASAGKQEDKGEAYWKFKKDTTWTYAGTMGGEKKTIILKVSAEEKDKSVIESKEFKEGEKEPEKSEKIAIYVEEGFVLWGEYREGTLEPLFKVLKIGAKKGDKWKGSVGGGALDYEATHLGTEEVKVPAGTYKEAIHVELKFSQEGAGGITLYLVPKVGLVKMETAGSGRSNTLELTEFKEAK